MKITHNAIDAEDSENKNLLRRKITVSLLINWGMLCLAIYVGILCYSKGYDLISLEMLSPIILSISNCCGVIYDIRRLTVLNKKFVRRGTPQT